MPVGTDPHAQELVRVIRRDKGQFDREDLADLRFVPMLGEQGWEGEKPTARPAPPRVIQHRPRTSETLPDLIRAHGEAFDDVETADLAPMMARIGDAKVVLIGEASHGTSEFYRMRARITRRLIEEKGFTIVAAEADWPDAARIDHYVRHRETPPSEWEAFARFPIWMWRNEEVRAFTDWLHEWNAPRAPKTRTGFYGLDLYSLFNSAKSIIDYLQDVDPELARIARQRYGCLSPWEADPAAYGHAALTGAYRDCEDPDAPGGTFHHWAAWGISPDGGFLRSGFGPESIEPGFQQAINDFDRPGYGGPCPPRGDKPHNYHFRLSALSEKISAGSAATCAEIIELARPHVIEFAELVGLYGRD